MNAPDRDQVDPSDAHDEPSEGRRPAPPGLTKFALFAEVLLTSVYVSVLSLGVVTALPAVTTGVAHLRRHLAATDDSVGTVWADFREACRGVWLVSAGAVLALFLVVLNLWAVSTGALPGGLLVGVVSVVVGAGILVALLRAAGSWSEGDAWWPLVREGARSILADPGGSLMLAAALGVCVVLVWMLAPLLIVVGGLLSFAVVAVGFRRATA